MDLLRCLIIEALRNIQNALRIIVAKYNDDVDTV